MPAKKALLHQRAEHLILTEDDIRWATPMIVAEYRAKRLRCKVIADLCCGAGFQAFAFAKQCRKVYAVEKDREKLNRAQENAQRLCITNIIFIQGDVLDPAVKEKMIDSTIVFCDPTRLPEEQTRSIATLTPNIDQLFALYSPITENIAVELPPQINIKDISLDGEREYISLYGKLNRLTLYCGDLKKSETTVVALHEKETVETVSTSPQQPKLPIQQAEKPETYLYDVSPAITKAGLLAELSEKTAAACLCEGKRTLFTSTTLVKSPFFCHAYRVLVVCPWAINRIVSKLQDLRAGSVTLRYSIPPKEYWNVRRQYETQLSGTRKITLFEWNGKALLTENVGL